MGRPEKTRTCPHCDGKGNEWHPNGGTHGIGRVGRCHVCKGEGKVTEAQWRWHLRASVETDRTYP